MLVEIVCFLTLFTLASPQCYKQLITSLLELLDSNTMPKLSLFVINKETYYDKRNAPSVNDIEKISMVSKQEWHAQIEKWFKMIKGIGEKHWLDD